MSTIDTSWENNSTGPFKDNPNAGSITAASMRAFAAAVRTQQIASSSAGMIYQGAYAGGTTYHLNDVVTSGGGAYICIVASSVGAAPPGGNWSLLAGPGSVVYGTTAGTAAEGNDARLSDQRVPTNASVTDAKISGTLSPSKITGTAVITSDARLSDQRVPLDASVTAAKISGTLPANKITGTAVTGTVDNTKLATMANLTVKGNTSDAPALPSDIPMLQLAGMLSGKLAASDIEADNTGGVTGPSVATALIALATAIANGNKFQ